MASRQQNNFFVEAVSSKTAKRREAAHKYRAESKWLIYLIFKYRQYLQISVMVSFFSFLLNTLHLKFISSNLNFLLLFLFLLLSSLFLLCSIVNHLFDVHDSAQRLTDLFAETFALFHSFLDGFLFWIFFLGWKLDTSRGIHSNPLIVRSANFSRLSTRYPMF